MKLQSSVSLVLACAALTLTTTGSARERADRTESSQPRAEFRAYWAETIALYDVNADGDLDQWERLILQRDIESGFLKVPAAAKGHESPRAFRRELVEMYDANSDGRLDQWERLILDRDIDAGDIRLPRRAVQVVASGN